MSELIRREDAIKATWQEPSYTDPLNVLTEVRDRIKALKAVDAVEIVRCGECKYWSEVDTSDGLRYGQCDRPHSAIRGNCFIRESWFCADGEREVQE